MKYDGIVVTNIIIPSFCMNHTEHAFLLKTRICRKTINGYMDLETNCYYSEKQQLGIDRIDRKSLIELSEYYNRLGFKNNNHYENKKEVYEKVKKLKQARKI